MKQYFRFIIYFITPLLFITQNARIFWGPEVDYWRFASLRFPGEECAGERVDDYHLSCGGTMTYRTSCAAWNSCHLVQDLATLFHGTDVFTIGEVIPLALTNPLIKNDYELAPAYTFNAMNSTVTVEGGYDFSYRGHSVRFNIRASAPFVTQSVINSDSGAMYCTQSNATTKTKSLHRTNPHHFHKKSSSTVASHRNGDPRIQLRDENGIKSFALRLDWFRDMVNKGELFYFCDNTVELPYVAVNKNLPAYEYIDSQGKQMEISDMLQGTVFVSDSSNNTLPLHQEQVQTVDASHNTVTTTSGTHAVLTIDPFTAASNGGPSGAVIPLTEYALSFPKGICIYNGIIDVPLALTPNVITDVTYGDTIVEGDTTFYSTNENTVAADALADESVIRIVATGRYHHGSNAYHVPEVTFSAPPVAIQKSRGGFPETFAVSVPCPNHQYSNDPSKQFDEYAPNNIILLRGDGTVNNNATVGALWFRESYQQLFSRYDWPDDNDLSLYLTTSLDEDGFPTDTSVTIYEALEGTNDMLDLRVDRLESNMDTLLNTTLPTIDRCFDKQTDLLFDEIKAKALIHGNNDARLSDTYCTSKNHRSSIDEEGFANGVSAPMQYSEFRRNGLGDILLECSGGSYFFDDKLIADVFVGAQLPTGGSIDDTNSYLAVPLGNNGHLGVRIGGQATYDILEQFVEGRLIANGYVQHTVAGMEMIVPTIEGKTITDFIPVKMATNVSWNEVLGFLGASIYTGGASGITLGYQYWHKGADTLCPLDSFPVSLPGITKAQNVSLEPWQQISNRSSHTLTGSFFSRISDDCSINLGISRVVAGTNSAAIFDCSGLIEIDF